MSSVETALSVVSVGEEAASVSLSEAVEPDVSFAEPVVLFDDPVSRELLSEPERLVPREAPLEVDEPVPCEEPPEVEELVPPELPLLEPPELEPAAPTDIFSPCS